MQHLPCQVVDAVELKHLRREQLVRKNKRVLVKETKRERRRAERSSVPGSTSVDKDERE